jgi:2'-5' RNA ligase
MRLFIAVDLERHILDQIEQLMASQKSTAPRARWLRGDQLHVTLLFLGEVAAEQVGAVGAKLTEVARAHTPLVLGVSAAGGFPTAARPRVLWLGLSGDTVALGALQRDLERALAQWVSSAESSAFQPHVTLARSRYRGGDSRLGQCATELYRVTLGPSSVREVVLYQSQPSSGGVRYTALLRAPLGLA